jgi:hypothetical protein
VTKNASAAAISAGEDQLQHIMRLQVAHDRDLRPQVAERNVKRQPVGDAELADQRKVLATNHFAGKVQATIAALVAARAFRHRLPPQ